MKELTEDLKSLGLSLLETQIYITLYQESGLTGYRIAKCLNRPLPNTYKALSTLSTKGLIVSEEGPKAKRYHILPISEYLNRRELSMKESRLKLEGYLEDLPPAKDSGGIFSLTDIDQVVSKAESLINNAQNIIMADLFPPVAKILTDQLKAAANRGIDLFIISYDDMIIPGCKHFKPIPGDAPLVRWKTDWLDICIDGEEFLIANLILEEREVLHALWGKNIYLGVNVATRLGYEMLLKELVQSAEQGGTNRQIKIIYDSLYKKLFKDSELISKYQKIVNR